MLTASEAEAYLASCPDVDSVRDFLQNAFRLKEKGESFQYGHVVEQLKTRDDAELLWRLYVALSSCIVQLTQRPDVHRELIQALFTYGWTLEDKISAAYTHLLGLLVSANPVFVIPVFQVVIKNFVAPDAHTLSSPPGDPLLLGGGGGVGSSPSSPSRHHWLHATLRGVVALAPAGQSELCAVLTDFFPYKLMPAGVQQQYVAQLLSVCQYLPHFQPKILELIISKCLEIDVDIVIEENGATDFREASGRSAEDDEASELLLFGGLDDVDDGYREEQEEDGGLGFFVDAGSPLSKRHGSRQQGGAPSGGAFETYCGGGSTLHRIGADVAEMADKLDAMLALLLNFINIQFNASDSTRERLFFQLLGSFEKVVLTVHRAKFVQFIMFYMCAKHEPYAILFARRLLEIFADPQQSGSGSAVRRQSAVMYLASLLSRLAPLSPAIIRETMLEVFLWCDEYTIQALGVSPSRTDAASFSIPRAADLDAAARGNEELNLFVSDENGNIHLRHETLYVAVQALCYTLCFYGGDLWISLLSAESLGPVRIRRVLLSPLCPLQFCAAAVRSEFISLVGRCESMSASENGGEGFGVTALDLQEANSGAAATDGGGGAGGLIGSTGVKLESFFPFDPCLLTTVHAFIAQYYQEWCDAYVDSSATKFTDAPNSSELWQVEELLAGGGGGSGAGGNYKTHGGSAGRHWSISTTSERSDSVMSSYDSSMLSTLITTYQEVLTSGQQLEPSAEAQLLRAVVARPAHSAAAASPSATFLMTTVHANNSAPATPGAGGKGGTASSSSTSSARRRLRARVGEEGDASVASKPSFASPPPSSTAARYPPPHQPLSLGGASGIGGGVPPPSQAEIDQMYARLIGGAPAAGQEAEARTLAPRGLAFAGSKSSDNLSARGSSNNPGVFGQFAAFGTATSSRPPVNASIPSLFSGAPLQPAVVYPPPSSASPSNYGGAAATALGLKDFQKRAREYSVGSVGSW